MNEVTEAANAAKLEIAKDLINNIHKSLESVEDRIFEISYEFQVKAEDLERMKIQALKLLRQDDKSRPILDRLFNDKLIKGFGEMVKQDG